LVGWRCELDGRDGVEDGAGEKEGEGEKEVLLPLSALLFANVPGRLKDGSEFWELFGNDGTGGIFDAGANGLLDL
jgi:hypothetical protein